MREMQFMQQAWDFSSA